MKKFIFSENSPYRYQRHIVFWLSWYFFCVLTDFDSNLAQIGETKTAFLELSENFLQVLNHALFCYTVIYFLFEKYFYKRKYLQFILSICIFTFLFLVLIYFVRIFLYNRIFSFMDIPLKTKFQTLWDSFSDFIIGAPLICGVLLGIKIFKNWYIKHIENKLLIKENSKAELQLLKSQIHPHFLFNTLNNIYSFALNKSSKAGEMVLQLSDIMKYMINDCKTEYVALNKELKMMDDYIGLEKVRYGKRLDMNVEITGDYNDKAITPLLMIPFLENSFKHGASKMLRNPWIQISIQADEDILHFTVANSKPADKFVNNKGGFGLNNVKKRLELLYPQNHLLVIESTENTFSVNMQIPLCKMQEKVVA